jgi:hypothetical protein
MSKGIEVELIRSHESRIIIRYDNEVYNLVGDNYYIYFNWWFESRRIKKKTQILDFLDLD